VHVSHDTGEGASLLSFRTTHDKCSLNVREKRVMTYLLGQDLKGFIPNRDLVGLLCFSFQFAERTRVLA